MSKIVKTYKGYEIYFNEKTLVFHTYLDNKKSESFSARNLMKQIDKHINTEEGFKYYCSSISDKLKKDMGKLYVSVISHHRYARVLSGRIVSFSIYGKNIALDYESKGKTGTTRIPLSSLGDRVVVSNPEKEEQIIELQNKIDDLQKKQIALYDEVRKERIPWSVNDS